MQEHVHTGPVAFVFAGISAILMIQLIKLVSAEMVKRSQLEPAGKVLGSIIQTD